LVTQFSLVLRYAELLQLSVQQNNWNEYQSLVVFQRAIRLLQSRESSKLFEENFDPMYNKLARCGSVTSYILQDFKQDSLTYLILGYYETL
jgi:hypothetical protein